MPAMQIPDSPFSLLVCAPFCAEPPSGLPQSGQPTVISSADQGLELLQPTLYLPLPQTLSPTGGIQLAFTRIADFRPESIVARTPWLKALVDVAVQERTRSASAAPASGDPLDNILEMVSLQPERDDSPGSDRELHTEADTVIAGLLTRIFNDDRFRRMEAAWRGVELLFNNDHSSRLKLSIAVLADDTAAETLEQLSRILVDDPPDLILCDAAFDTTPPGMGLLESLSALAEQLLSPAICWCGPAFFHIDGWSGMETLPYLPNHLDGFSYARWKTLRARPSASWIIAACNGLTLRPPHRCSEQAGFFHEGSGLTASPAWGVTALMLQGGIDSRDLCAATGQELQPCSPLDDSLCGTETAISHERLQQLHACGITPLVTRRHGRIGIADPVTIDGNSAGTGIALSWVIHTLIALRSGYGPADDGRALAQELQQLFSDRLRNQPVAGISELQLTFADETAAGAIVLAVALRTERAKSIEFTFTW